MKPSTIATLIFTCAVAVLAAGEEEKPATEVAVQVAKVKRATLTRAVTAFGEVEPQPAAMDAAPAMVKLSPAVAGIVTEIHGEEGQPVKKGDVLFKLDSRAVDATRAKAEQAVEFATTTVERQKKLIAAEGTSAKQVMEAEQSLATAKAELADAMVQQSLLVGTSPLSGTLVRFSARPGEAADPTTVLAEVADLDRLEATVGVPRVEAVTLKIGQAAKVLATDGERTVAGKVVHISPLVDGVTDTVGVRLSLPAGSGLRVGEFVTAKITIEEHANKLAVPREAIYTDNTGQSTLSLVSGDMATKKVVKVGLHDGDLIEVEGDGITEGATVVTLGSYALPEQTKVRILAVEKQ